MDSSIATANSTQLQFKVELPLWLNVWMESSESIIQMSSPSRCPTSLRPHLDAWRASGIFISCCLSNGLLGFGITVSFSSHPDTLHHWSNTLHGSQARVWSTPKATHLGAVNDRKP